MTTYTFQIIFMVDLIRRFIVKLTQNTAENFMLAGITINEKQEWIPDLLIDCNIQFSYKNTAFKFVKNKSEVNLKCYEYFLSIEANTFDDAKEHFNSFLEDANKYNNQDYVIVNICDIVGHKPISITFPKRSLDTVYHNEKYNLMDDIEDFLSSQKIYQQNGIIHVRKYLFTGQHNTGKTTMIRAIATKLSTEIFRVELNFTCHIDLITQIKNAINMMSFDGKIFVIEDIDRIFTDVSVEDFFSEIGGLACKSNSLIFMTTTKFNNFSEKLDNGMIDSIINFTHPDKTQIKEMFNHFFPDSENLFKDFVNKLNLQAMRFPLLEKFFLKHRNTEDIITAADELAKLSSKCVGSNFMFK